MTVINNRNKVIIPQLGLTMTQATIVEWLKPEGAWVEKGEILFSLENEKSVLEIESPASGYLHIIKNAGETVPVLGQIGELTLEENSQAQQGFQSKELGKLPEPGLTAIQPQGHIESDKRIAASPKARRIAKSRNLNLESIQGSGPRGMIIARDVLEAEPLHRIKASPVARRIAAEAGVELAGVAGSGPRGQVMQRDVEKMIDASRNIEQIVSPSVGKTLPLSGLRGVIAERLSASWLERPQVTLTTEADATFLVAARQQINAELTDRAIKVSYNAILVYLVAKAIEENPGINVRLTETGLQTLPYINIGIAVDTPGGLLVPVIKDTHKKTILEIHQTLSTLTEKAIKGKCLPDDLTGGTFTITNLGMFDIDAFTPLINPPECAILGVGRIIEKPVGINGQVVLRSMMALSLSFDHRLIDGAPAARFLQRIKQRIERILAFSFLESK